jgi:hypothetical protein
MAALSFSFVRVIVVATSFLALLLGVCAEGMALPQPIEEPSRGPFWHLPVHISDSLVSVSFEVDSTWHLIKGTTAGVTGDVWLADPNDSHSVRARIIFPIVKFQTGDESRDIRMREVLHADRFPAVTLSILDIGKGCNPLLLNENTPCHTILNAELQISGNLGRTTIPATVTSTPTDYSISGQTSLRWREYGVEDPSILVAHLDPTVSVHFAIKLPAEKTNGGDSSLVTPELTPLQNEKNLMK